MDPSDDGITPGNPSRNQDGSSADSPLPGAFLPSTEAEFEADYKATMTRLGAKIRPAPRCGGRVLSLWPYWCEVQSYGGIDGITKARMWRAIGNIFGIPSSITSLAFTVRRHYTQIFVDYEHSKYGDLRTYTSALPGHCLLFPNAPAKGEKAKSSAASGGESRAVSREASVNQGTTTMTVTSAAGGLDPAFVVKVKGKKGRPKGSKKRTHDGSDARHSSGGGMSAFRAGTGGALAPAFLPGTLPTCATNRRKDDQGRPLESSALLWDRSAKPPASNPAVNAAAGAIDGTASVARNVRQRTVGPSTPAAASTSTSTPSATSPTGDDVDAKNGAQNDAETSTNGESGSNSAAASASTGGADDGAGSGEQAVPQPMDEVPKEEETPSKPSGPLRTRENTLVFSFGSANFRFGRASDGLPSSEPSLAALRRADYLKEGVTEMMPGHVHNPPQATNSPDEDPELAEAPPGWWEGDAMNHMRDDMRLLLRPIEARARQARRDPFEFVAGHTDRGRINVAKLGVKESSHDWSLTSVPADLDSAVSHPSAGLLVGTAAMNLPPPAPYDVYPLVQGGYLSWDKPRSNDVPETPEDAAEAEKPESLAWMPANDPRVSALEAANSAKATGKESSRLAAKMEAASKKSMAGKRRLRLPNRASMSTMLSTLVSKSMSKHMDLHLASGDGAQYSVVVVVPDIVDQYDLELLCDVLVGPVSEGGCGFGEVTFLQSSTAACFGTGLSGGLIVDIGASKTSLTIVEDGYVDPNSCRSMAYGGDDITRVFAWSIAGQAKTPAAEHAAAELVKATGPVRNGKEAQMLKVLNHVKNGHCHLNLGATVNYVPLEFSVPGYAQPGHHYSVSVAESLVMAPMGLFHPVVFSPRARHLTSAPKEPMANDWLEAGRYPLASKLPNPLNVDRWVKQFELVPLHRAILNLVATLPDKSTQERALGSILVVGGVAKTAGLCSVLETKLRDYTPLLVKGVSGDVVSVYTTGETLQYGLRTPQPDVLAWRGGTVVAGVGLMPHLWLSSYMWKKGGLQALKRRVTFPWLPEQAE